MVQASVVPLIGPLSYDHCAEAGITASVRHKMASETIRVFKDRTLLLGSIRELTQRPLLREPLFSKQFWCHAKFHKNFTFGTYVCRCLRLCSRQFPSEDP